MMTRQLQVSILAAPLAAIDRRALSLAWYSALHLARDQRHEPHTRGGNSRGAQPRKRVGVELVVPEDVRSGVHARASLGGLAFRPISGDKAVWGIVDRRMPRLPLATRIESCLFERRSQAKRASFTIGRGRVHVVLQSKGDRVVLVALCSPTLRIIVARALAQARFALAARGIRGEFEAKGAQRCS
jgi:hypothetical protein